MYLKIFTGPMFSGKTTSLVNYLNDNKEKECLYINHDFDTRDKDFSSHNPNLKLDSQIERKKCETLMEICLEKYNIIGIDECQFFGDLYDFVVSNNFESKIIVLSGLYADIHLSQFGQLINCFPMADEINILYSNCYKCGEKCLYTRKIVNDEKQIEVGGNNLYEASCKKCFYM